MLSWLLKREVYKNLLKRRVNSNNEMISEKDWHSQLFFILGSDHEGNSFTVNVKRSHSIMKVHLTLSVKETDTVYTMQGDSMELFNETF